MTRLMAISILLCASTGAKAGSAMLVWNYVEPKPDMVFEVWRSDDLKGWELHDLTTATNLQLSTSLTAEFFKVRARDVVTGWTNGCAASFVCTLVNPSKPAAMLVWNYVEPKPEIVFEVWRFVDAKKWEFCGLTTTTNFPISKAGLFKVRARDVTTGWTRGCAVRVEYPSPAVQSVTLGWDASPDSAITGYNVYYGSATGTYTNRISVGDVTSATVTNLVGGVTYYFAVKARNSAGLEAAPSNEVFWRPPP